MGDNKVAGSTKERLQRLEELRGKPIGSVPFWDVVVITALDSQQKQVYELQITKKLQGGQLPLGVKYLVFADPPGAKIGCGGSTLEVLYQLRQQYGKELDNWKVLLIHAGGYSQRLPSASVLGKVFMAAPLGCPMWQMLELKLALYMDFPQRMKPGIFLCSSDTVETFECPPHANWSFTLDGFTALAHPSPVSIGTGHGVFILDGLDSVDGVTGNSVESVSMRECEQFIHKPTVQEMHSKGAVLPQEASKCFLKNTNSTEPIVYTDSAFYFDHQTGDKLLDFYEKNRPLNCELEAYGDFLRPLGPNATDEYVNIAANVCEATSDLAPTKTKLFELLKGLPLHVVLMNNSRFYHLGTTAEYLDHLCCNASFQTELGLSPKVFTAILAEENKASETVHKLSKLAHISDEVCLMHSVVSSDATIGGRTVVEYSDVGPNVDVGANCIISNCVLKAKTATSCVVPDYSFMHSVAVTEKETKVQRYVTIMFDIRDDMKKSVAPEDAGKLRYYGMSFDNVAECLQKATPQQLFPSNTQSCSLWNAELFPLSDDMASSTSVAMGMVRALHGGKTCPGGDDIKRVSMATVMSERDTTGMLQFRDKLLDKISAALKK
ncbi:PREDICTED: fucose-1-phosphate guanylyltransferase-like [Branchiostoma belcheri]|uniref:Fucose-1-phosphate guanylyltransferase-like n=1 Tax=Branchiostoma belcheri TaxID=7741 RepID=A0A6P4YBL1_BRABE|nr:PREDICTED: fucose-1-phosphate guanylyltransferase-like [Branchiostoma belcheri]XP_019621843.1 PREDICTED: fucose-1-phosphate guanylyltransferase-like [Branchiostoma belcheri]